ncbi:MAG: ABC transporter permease [Actinomycetota bacterium]|nr:ABC transporter permease [Actinomycetota bacterium]
MSRVLRSELLKLRTTRTALGFAVAGVLLVLLVVLVGTLAGDPKTILHKREVLSIGDPLAVVLLLFGVVGATAEYRHRTVAAGALIVPSRLRLSVGRMVAYGLAGLAVGALMLAVSFAIGLPLLSGTSGPSLGASDYAQAIFGSLLACGLGAMLGVAIGVLIANQVAAVVGTLVIVFVVDPLIVQLSDNVGKFLFGNALTAVAGRGTSHQLAFGAAVAVILAWTALALGVAGWVDSRRDIS